MIQNCSNKQWLLRDVLTVGWCHLTTNIVLIEAKASKDMQTSFDENQGCRLSMEMRNKL
jgi:hypothetical protein